jgi:hypothetical protein
MEIGRFGGMILLDICSAVSQGPTITLETTSIFHLCTSPRLSSIQRANPGRLFYDSTTKTKAQLTEGSVAHPSREDTMVLPLPDSTELLLIRDNTECLRDSTVRLLNRGTVDMVVNVSPGQNDHKRESPADVNLSSGLT